jgi:pimeloyl-ACP methyl ester carboxylesterase
LFNYDRRGRGESGDTAPYAAGREIDDLRAVIDAAGGRAMVFGGSSGGGLALMTAAAVPAVSKVAVWEPPYHVDRSAPVLSEDFADRLGALVGAGRRGDAVAMFMVEAAAMPLEAVTAMRAGPAWPQAEAIAHTLAYEAAVMGPGNALPAATLARLTQPTLVLTGRAQPGVADQRRAGGCRCNPSANHRVLAGRRTAFPRMRSRLRCWNSSPPDADRWPDKRLCERVGRDQRHEAELRHVPRLALWRRPSVIHL